MDEFINQLILDLPGRLCMDKCKLPTYLRINVRVGNYYYNNFIIRDLGN